uniref:Tf2-1-like SH3-like domain-containing protein n=1 Tax=Vitis vinifera TaxID=29760 RepID=A5BEP2_VITVI|nr:hypothetical protein VITISV_004521 [Vitis vinifera]
MQTQRPRCVSWDCGVKQTNTPYGAKQTPTSGSGIGSDTICNDPHPTVRHKSYADQRRRDLEFEVGDHVFLKVSPMKSVMRFGRKGKLSPRFVGPFEILERVVTLAYKVALPPSLSKVHNVFHVSTLRKYIYDPSHVVELEPIQISEDLNYEEVPVQIVDVMDKVLRHAVVKLVKVQWSNHSVREATRELEEEMREKHPQLFQDSGMSSLED